MAHARADVALADTRTANVTQQLEAAADAEAQLSLVVEQQATLLWRLEELQRLLAAERTVSESATVALRTVRCEYDDAVHAAKAAEEEAAAVRGLLEAERRLRGAGERELDGVRAAAATAEGAAAEVKSLLNFKDSIETPVELEGPH